MKHNGNQATKPRKNGHSLTPKFGPVDNLESYLQPD